MLRQEELAFIKVLPNFQVSAAVLKELRMALSRKKRLAVPAGSSSTAPVGWAGAQTTIRTARRQAKANELASSGDSSEPANRRAEPSDGPRLCPRMHRQSRLNKLLRAAGNSVRPRVG
jgi:hypothetical protein